jgi:hypothetical protein
MKRLPPAVSQTYHDFWATLLPASNRRTGFSLRSPARRSFIEFDHVGFRFRYHLAYDAPDATIEFALRRSDGDQIYASLVQQRAQIDAAFGEPLQWLRDARSASEQWPYRALRWTVSCSPLRDLDRSAWPALQAQMIDAMVHLERAIVPHLQQWLPAD